MILITKTTVKKTFESVIHGVAVIGAQVPHVYAVFVTGGGQNAVEAAAEFIAQCEHMTLKTIPVFVPEMHVTEENDGA